MGGSFSTIQRAIHVHNVTLLETLDPELTFDTNGEPAIKVVIHSDKALDASGLVPGTTDDLNDPTTLVKLDEIQVSSTLTSDGGIPLTLRVSTEIAPNSCLLKVDSAGRIIVLFNPLPPATEIAVVVQPEEEAEVKPETAIASKLLVVVPSEAPIRPPATPVVSVTSTLQAQEVSTSSSVPSGSAPPATSVVSQPVSKPTPSSSATLPSSSSSTIATTIPNPFPEPKTLAAFSGEIPPPPIIPVPSASNASSATVYNWVKYRIVTAKQPILLLGESSNRSLSLALGLMRGSLDGVWPTSLATETSAPKSRDKIFSDILTRISENTGSQTISKAVQSEWKALQKANIDHLYLSVFDATALGDLHVRYPKMPTKNIWFQCPWKSSNEEVSKLLRKFITSASQLQKVGDAIYLGLILGYKVAGTVLFEGAYGLPGLEASAAASGYRIFRDKQMIQECVQRGYKHRCCSEGMDIHRKVKAYFVTVVFIKCK